jgi:hypothetical protein
MLAAAVMIKQCKCPPSRPTNINRGIDSLFAGLSFGKGGGVMSSSDGKGGSTPLPGYLVIPSAINIKDVTLDVSLFPGGYY